MEAGVHAGEILSDGGQDSPRSGHEDALWVLHFCPVREEKKADWAELVVVQLSRSLPWEAEPYPYAKMNSSETGSKHPQNDDGLESEASLHSGQGYNTFVEHVWPSPAPARRLPNLSGACVPPVSERILAMQEAPRLPSLVRDRRRKKS